MYVLRASFYSRRLFRRSGLGGLVYQQLYTAELCVCLVRLFDRDEMLAIVLKLSLGTTRTYA